MVLLHDVQEPFTVTTIEVGGYFLSTLDLGAESVECRTSTYATDAARRHIDLLRVAAGALARSA